MSKISGSEAVIKCLLEEGVDIIYGYPGGAIMPVYDELYKYQDKIQEIKQLEALTPSDIWKNELKELKSFLQGMKKQKVKK